MSPAQMIAFAKAFHHQMVELDHCGYMDPNELDYLTGPTEEDPGTPANPLNAEMMQAYCQNLETYENVSAWRDAIVAGFNAASAIQE